MPIGRHSGNNPDDFQKSWTDPPYFVDPLEILNISCPMYNGKHERNLLCAVDVDDYGQLLPDIKIKDSVWKFPRNFWFSVISTNFVSTSHKQKAEKFFFSIELL